MLKNYWWGGWSVQVAMWLELGFELSWTGLGLGLLGIKELGPGLDNY